MSLITLCFIFIWVFPKIMGTPKSSILIGFSIINHPFLGYPYFRKHPYRYPFLISRCCCSGKSWLCRLRVPVERLAERYSSGAPGFRFVAWKGSWTLFWSVTGLQLMMMMMMMMMMVIARERALDFWHVRYILILYASIGPVISAAATAAKFSSVSTWRWTLEESSGAFDEVKQKQPYWLV